MIERGSVALPCNKIKVELGLGGHVREAKIVGIIVDKGFQFLFELVDPVHRVKLREAGVLFGVLDVW